jgi:Kef-type K+ transport system membrane component KefB
MGNLVNVMVSNVDFVSVLLPIALILIVCKTLSLGCQKIGLPQVIGYLVAGLLLSLIKFIPGQRIFTDTSTEGLSFIAKIGVILIMFSAGIGTDLKKVKATGVKSVLITLAGVIVPMGLGFIVAVLCFGGFGSIGENYKQALFYGCILTATSVSVTVATLKELGKLDSEMGTCIISAAILDDIIGVIVLSLVLGLDGAASDSASFINLLSSWGIDATVGSVISIVIYFIVFIAVGVGISKLMNFLARKYDHHRRIPIYAFAICFAYAWVAEEIFGVADITGAFLAGILLSNNYDRKYIDRRTDIFSGFLFAPIFFANIGISMKFEAIDASFILFGLLFVLAGIVGKLIGCGITAKACGFSWKESASIGIGMMVRAEVALVCMQKGVDANIIDSRISTFVVMLILATSLVAPILLKILNQSKPKINKELVEDELAEKMLEDSEGESNI